MYIWMEYIYIYSPSECVYVCVRVCIYIYSVVKCIPLCIVSDYTCLDVCGVVCVQSHKIATFEMQDVSNKLHVNIYELSYIYIHDVMSVCMTHVVRVRLLWCRLTHLTQHICCKFAAAARSSSGRETG